MGIRLIVEVLDHWQDVGLTAGERGDLLVLAENANDKSRETWGPVHAPHILKRAAKTPASWRIAINRLMKKKALEFAKRDGKEVRGYTGQHAVYRLVELCPEPPHDGYKGHCTRPVAGSSEDLANADSVTSGHSVEDSLSTSEEGYLTANAVPEDQEEGYLTANPEGYLTANAVDGLGYLTATERVSCQLTPTPPVSSFNLSSKDSSSSVAEDSSTVTDTATVAEEGGGGGNLSLEEITNQSERAEAFVDSLPFKPGRPPGKKQRQQIVTRVVAAFKAGWTENGLRRYLDVSDDPNVRSAASVYVHRLDPEELPDNEVPDVAVPNPCDVCWSIPGAFDDPSRRVNPITGDPCPRCHPSAAQQATRLPPACESCLAFSPAAEVNVRLRSDHLSFHGGPCPRCHPSKVPGNWSWPGMDGVTGARAAARPAEAYTSSSVDDLYAPRLPGDRNVLGWLQLSQRLEAQEGANRGSKPMVASGGHQPYRDPVDQSVYDRDFFDNDTEPADQSRYDQPL